MTPPTVTALPIVALALCAHEVTPTPSAGTSPIPLAGAAAIFEEAAALSAADDSRLWGVEIAGPILLVDPVTRAVVANQADADGILEARDSGSMGPGFTRVHAGALPPDVNVANTATEWAGRTWTMLMWPLPENRYARRKLLAHELYHRIQNVIGLPANAPTNTHLDSRDGRIWLRLEMRALAEALIRDGDDRRRALTDALEFRAHRHALFPGSADEERALELNEGLAEYTGFRLSGLPDRVLPDRAAVQLDQYDTRPSLVRSFAYATGPAYALLLDAAVPDGSWRDDRDGLRERGLSGTALPSFDIVPIRSAAAIPGDSALAERARSSYDGDRVFAEENAREAARAERDAGYRARFIDGPVLFLPDLGELHYSFDPSAVDAFDDAGTVYRTLRLTDSWGVLEVTSGGALMRREDGRVRGFVVPAPAESPAPQKGAGGTITGDGWMLSLDPGYVLARGEREGDYTIVIR